MLAGSNTQARRGSAGCSPTTGTLARPRYWRMLGEILRFHRCARAVLDTPADEAGAQEPLGEFLSRNGFSPYFVENFMTPLVAAVWSCDPTTAAHYPARYLFTFLEHHGMLTVFGSPTWRTVTGGSARYVEKVAAHLERYFSTPPVQQVERTPDGGACVVDGRGDVRYFDAVVVAVHPRQALAMLGDASNLETEILGDMPYSVNHAQLHTDESLLPRAENARASWNYLTPADSTDATGVIVTYDMTRLMRLDTVRDRRFLVTLGGKHLVDPSKVVAEMTYEHPVYTPRFRGRAVAVARTRFLYFRFRGRLPRLGVPRGRGALGFARRRTDRRIVGYARRATPRTGDGVVTAPAIYSTTIRHARTEPVRNSFEYSSYSWYVDVDDLPRLPGWLGPFARFRAEDHFEPAPVPARTRCARGGCVPRHTRSRPPRRDGDGAPQRAGARLRVQPAQRVLVPRRRRQPPLRDRRGAQHLWSAAQLPDPARRQRPREVDKQFYVSPFNDVSGRYEMRFPEPGDRLSLNVVLHRDGHAPFTATVRGTRRPATRRTVLRTQLRTPLAPLVVSARIRIQGITLWARGLPVTARPDGRQKETVQ